MPPTTNNRTHLLLAATGSVATIKIPNIITALARHTPHLSIRVILTNHAQNFLAGQSAEQPTVASLLSLPGVEAVYDDRAEWGPEPWTRGADILHIELRRWADILVIAPLSANTLAKLANGFSDNLLTSVCRAWDTDGQVDGRRKRIVVAPAMNTAMWRHPVTAKHVRVLEEEWGVRRVEGSGDGEETGWFEVLRPQASKVLACGDVGSGAMLEWTEIVKVVEARLGLSGEE
ncbi:flavo protein [Aspergillus heteromorphus CBS 117.55]|uniref:Flavo protein n=1 Tax=Aspergillus heteromorphus CBS 117.55 TaxID=1448321 RepID=A0A317X1J1_9EURO|nr:flavo protein [Aspergillus heteromorphus CBS 117.55]PWY92195.1 flavo protein [Aspergillus heteromorphus CBS 117.55]